MDEGHRYRSGQLTPEIDTVFDFTAEQGIIRAAEMCNGTGDCRKGVESGGTMCPSYMALRDERETTRGRANVLREILTRGPTSHRKKNISGKDFFDSEEIREVMEFCLSCKGCKAECPSNVDMAKLKAEFQHQYYLSRGIPWRVRLIAFLPRIWKWLNRLQGGRQLYNTVISSGFFHPILTRLLGFTSSRPLPRLSSVKLNDLSSEETPASNLPTVYLFADEFTRYQETELGNAAIRLLRGLGYRVVIPALEESGRTAISKGLLLPAREALRKNLRIMSPLITPETPLVGLEPSALLTLRDEGISLLRGEEQSRMISLGENILLLEEFLDREISCGRIDSSRFTEKNRRVICHVHCHQKALSDLEAVKRVLSLPRNYQVEMIPSGCCGMAGSFGYEKKNYQLSLKIGELVLFPRIRNSGEELITATGMSCREQIYHGTGRRSLHPAQVLAAALLS